MREDLFNLDDSLLEENPRYKREDNLKKARALCIRGQYEQALDLYNAVLEDDFENEDALIGILRVHSQDFTILESEDISKDIHAIESMCPDTMNEDYISYLEKRNGHKASLKVGRANTKEELEELEAVIDSGKSYLSRYCYDECIDLVRYMHERFPNEPSLNYFLGESYAHKNKWKEAIPLLEACIENSDESYWAYPLANYRLGTYYSQTGFNYEDTNKSVIDFDKAIEYFLKARKKSPLYIDSFIRYIEEMKKYPLLVKVLNMHRYHIFRTTRENKLLGDSIGRELSKQGCSYGRYYYGCSYDTKDSELIIDYEDAMSPLKESEYSYLTYRIMDQYNTIYAMNDSLVKTSDYFKYKNAYRSYSMAFDKFFNLDE